MADTKVLDFTNVKEGGGSFRKTRQVAGDYKGQITKAATTKIKSGENKGQDQWLFTIKVGSGIYPYYCQLHDPDLLWKVRNLFVAAGKNVPKKRLKVDPQSVVGKSIGVTLEDDEYEGKAQSNIAAVFPVSELEADDDDDEDTDDDAEDDEDDDSDDDDDEDEEEPPPPPKQKKKKDKKKKAASSDDELEELDIEDI